MPWCSRQSLPRKFLKPLSTSACQAIDQLWCPLRLPFCLPVLSLWVWYVKGRWSTVVFADEGRAWPHARLGSPSKTPLFAVGSISLWEWWDEWFFKLLNWMWNEFEKGNVLFLQSGIICNWVVEGNRKTSYRQNLDCGLSYLFSNASYN